MEHQQQLADKWSEVRAKLKQKWHKLTDEDLRVFDGNVEQLVGRIQRRTGETRDAIERYLEQFSEEGSDIAEDLRERVQAGAAQVSAVAQQGYDAFREGYSEAERIVKDRPGQAVAIAFGMGLVAGLGAAFLLHERSYEMHAPRSRGARERFGHQILEALASIMPNR